jgi:hypothetical protein
MHKDSTMPKIWALVVTVLDICQGLPRGAEKNCELRVRTYGEADELVAFRGALRGAAAMAGVLALVLVAGVGIRAFPGPRQAPQIMLLYVGAEDCAPCRAWEFGEKVAFKASAEFPRVIYREVKSPTLFDVLKDENWPEDLRGYRNRLGRDAGVPLWLVIADEQIIYRGMGPSQWRSNVLPKINELLH